MPTGYRNTLAVLLTLTLAAVWPRTARGQACTTALDCPGGAFHACSLVVCDNGQCTFPQRDCNDGDPCTVDSCVEPTGCQHVPLCPDDGLACDGVETCVVLSYFLDLAYCPLTLAPDCNDGDACTIDSCVEPTGCQHVALSCDDGDECTADACDPYARQGSSPCVHTAIAGCCHTAVDCPSDACDTATCQSSVCGTQPVSCDDGDPATLDSCDPIAGCRHASPPCSSDADCTPSQDPCVSATCGADRTCSMVPAAGDRALACVCERALPSTCSGAPVPRRITALSMRACRRVQAFTRATGRRRVHLARRAHAAFLQGVRASTASKRLGGACATALASQFDDAAARAGEWTSNGASQ